MSQQNSPVDMLVFAQYGRTMLAVQAFEMMLATLTLTLEANPARRSTNLERSMRRLVRRHVHAFQRASPNEMRRRLAGKIDADLLTEVHDAIRWRDRLAHRYLRENLVQSDGGIFDRAALTELASLAGTFDSLTSKVQAVLMQRVEQLRSETNQHGEPPAPPAEVYGVVADLARSILLPPRGE